MFLELLKPVVMLELQLLLLLILLLLLLLLDLLLLRRDDARGGCGGAHGASGRAFGLRGCARFPRR